jgi:DNA-binding GntR family transcriptional regulator
MEEMGAAPDPEQRSCTADLTDLPPLPAAHSLTEQAYRRLEEEIVTLQLPPGTVVSETALSQRTGLGRTPVREALQRLAREGLVRILPRRGIVVTAIDPHQQLRLLAVRREVERLLARLAASMARPEECKQFLRLAEGMEQAAAARDELAFIRLDRSFHWLTGAAARNEFAQGALMLMSGLSRRFWFAHAARFADLATIARRHAAVARAIAAGDAEGAARATDLLLDDIEAFSRRVAAA